MSLPDASGGVRSALLGYGLLALSVAAGLHAGWYALHDAPLLAGLAHLVAAAGAGGSALFLQGERRISTALGAALLVLCLPGVGLIGFVLVALPSWHGPLPRTRVRLVERALPDVREELATSMREPQLPVSNALDPSSSVEVRVAAVRALRQVDAALAVPLLRDALGDPSEDVRLLAHAVLDRRERRIRAQLDALREQLTELELAGAQEQTQAPLHAALASQYWLLYQAGFVGRDACQAVLEQAAEHARRGCGHPLHRSSVVIAIRALLALSNHMGAFEALRWAKRQHVPAALLKPLAAELAYLERRS